MKKSIIVLSIILIVAFGTVAGLYGTGFLSPAPKVKVRIGYLTGDLHHLALHVAVARNYFAQYGLEYELYEYINGPTLMQHFVVGELDFAYVGTPPALTARASGISSNATHLPVVIGSGNLEGSALVVNPAIIKNVGDLENKKIGTPGTGTIQDVLISTYAKNNNLTITKYPGRISDLPLQYGRGEIDGFIGWEPYPSIAAYQYNASILLTSHEIMPNHQCCVLVVSDKFLAAHPEIVDKMVAIHKASIDFINTNPAEAKQLAMNITKLPMPVIELAFSHMSFSKSVNVESIRAFLVDMIRLGIIKNIDVNQVDNFINGFINTKYVAG
ncbi:MAG: ABC transporter substrate-binding protein [Candidatus Methanomethylicaceae archaeon]|nr:ABC transporter substrate-binding protein [Candidatus Verstraetearchaeota archaeon]